jgi:hypothetical protein
MTILSETSAPGLAARKNGLQVEEFEAGMIVDTAPAGSTAKTSPLPLATSRVGAFGPVAGDIGRAMNGSSDDNVKLSSNVIPTILAWTEMLAVGSATTAPSSEIVQRCTVPLTVHTARSRPSELTSAATTGSLVPSPSAESVSLVPDTLPSAAKRQRQRVLSMPTDMTKVPSLLDAMRSRSAA